MSSHRRLQGSSQICAEESTSLHAADSRLHSDNRLPLVKTPCRRSPTRGECLCSELPRSSAGRARSAYSGTTGFRVSNIVSSSIHPANSANIRDLARHNLLQRIHVLNRAEPPKCESQIQE